MQFRGTTSLILTLSWKVHLPHSLYSVILFFCSVLYLYSLYHSVLSWPVSPGTTAELTFSRAPKKCMRSEWVNVQSYKQEKFLKDIKIDRVCYFFFLSLIRFFGHAINLVSGISLSSFQRIRGRRQTLLLYVQKPWPHSWVSLLRLYRHLRKDKYKERNSLMCYLMA